MVYAGPINLKHKTGNKNRREKMKTKKAKVAHRIAVPVLLPAGSLKKQAKALKKAEKRLKFAEQETKLSEQMKAAMSDIVEATLKEQKQKK
jgi:hypothetical protein